jgi:hypothetical protein
MKPSGNATTLLQLPLIRLISELSTGKAEIEAVLVVNESIGVRSMCATQMNRRLAQRFILRHTSCAPPDKGHCDQVAEAG